jgi:hypothetical protein
MPKLAIVQPPLSPARERLRQLNEQMREAQAELAEARTPEQRLVDAIAGARRSGNRAWHASR